MEEPDTGGREPVDLRCAQQPGLLSLIISGEEEATRQDSDLGGKLLLFSVFPHYTVSVCVAVKPRPLSDRQLIRVRDNAMEQHGPYVCVAPINKGSTAHRQADLDTRLPPSGVFF